MGKKKLERTLKDYLNSEIEHEARSRGLLLPRHHELYFEIGFVVTSVVGTLPRVTPTRLAPSARSAWQKHFESIRRFSWWDYEWDHGDKRLKTSVSGPMISVAKEQGL